MAVSLMDLGAVGAGALVGGVLGLVGGGGSILAVPLLVYGVGVPSAHLAIGTSALAVSLNALAGLAAHARAGHVKWPCAIVFSMAGVAGAAAGSTIAKYVEGQRLLTLFGLMMIVVGVATLRTPRRPERPDVRLSWNTRRELAPPLVGMGLGVGALSGFFGIGGGFLIVPGLIGATQMPLITAIGTSLVSVAAFGATTATNYALSGLVDWRIAALFIAGGIFGGAHGVMAARALAARKNALRVIFGVLVVAVGIYVSARGAMAGEAG